ncbi:pyridoxal phosphate-dependent aminotransferase [Verrucomicrobiales bacterium]|nr:pyridoxal phosphate-dependent aminotransferase [Verrucomicrobiales bacterium]MDB4720129.1 pyridoxal phosphate-dependent aminotransferase [Verrucomicrobiales bacterium]MDB4738070.1 pyridoxal phosphate-dependent aminotransferase [Verrucomicrobiales bacterium]MDB4783441.1 pyridoxal phosphate-dependent aminotransferase [Verrucomicrobiales bacterium]|tara:strand:+ start:2703 stop:3869 length:1167 start_codon:yes stop_codon:yes gene_type:complete
MEFIAETIADLTPSLTLSITSQAKQMREEGIDVCNLGAGEPDFDTPQHIKSAAIDALQDGQTKYTAVAGLLALRKGLSKKLREENQLNYEPNEIVVNCGAKHSCFNAIMACCDAGDEVIIPAPYWTSYPEMVRAVGAEPVFVETKQENNWKITAQEFDDAMTGSTKMIIINSPNNPTGAVYTRDELAAIGEVAASEDILILSDEIYEKLIYGESEHVSIGSISDEISKLTITINGFSKAYSMTGWRLGYTAATKEIADAIDTIQSHSTSNPTTFAQYGAIAALTGDQSEIADMVEEYNVRRQYVLGRLNSIANVSTIEPDGAFYFLINIEKTGIKSVNFAEKLLSRMQVATVPGVAFGNDHSIRISYAASLPIIKEGLDRLEEFCKAH